MKIELLQWLYVAIVAPLLGGIGGWISGILRTRRSRKQLVDYLSGLPIESKSVLVEFITKERHTMRGDPNSPPVRVLIQHGVLAKGSGGGTYDAIDSYLSVSNKFWSVRHDWLTSDIEAMQIQVEHLNEQSSA